MKSVIEKVDGSRIIIFDDEPVIQLIVTATPENCPAIAIYNPDNDNMIVFPFDKITSVTVHKYSR